MTARGTISLISATNPMCIWFASLCLASSVTGTAIAGPLWITDTAGLLFRFDGSSGTFISSSTGGGMDNPLGVAMGPDGNIYVASNNSNRNILTFSGNDGTFAGQFTSDPNLSNEALFDLAVGPDDNFYVAVPTANLIRRYSGVSGAFLDNFSTVDGGPVGLTFGPDFNLYVATANSSEIIALDGVTGNILNTFSAAELHRAAGLAFGPDGGLYVASQFTDTIIRFDTSNGASSVFSTGGSLDAPNGVAFGPDGDLYVTSLTTGSVLRYSGSTGLFEGQFIAPHAGGLSQPAHLAFTVWSFPVPEPSTIPLFLGGLVLFVGRQRALGRNQGWVPPAGPTDRFRHRSAANRRQPITSMNTRVAGYESDVGPASCLG